MGLAIPRSRIGSRAHTHAITDGLGGWDSETSFQRGRSRELGWSFNSDVGETATGVTGRPNPDVGSAGAADGAHDHDAGGAETADPDQTQSDDAARAKEREAPPPIPKNAPSAAQDRSAVADIDLFNVFFTELPMIERVPTAYWE